MRLADVAAAQLVADRARELFRGRAAGRYQADQRQGDLAAGSDGVGVGEPVLPEHHDSEPIAGIERIGRFVGGRSKRDDRRGICRGYRCRGCWRGHSKGLRRAVLIHQAVEIALRRHRGALHSGLYAPADRERKHQHDEEAAWPHRANPNQQKRF